MRTRILFVTGMSLAFMVLGLILAVVDADGNLGRRFFFIAVGVLGWFIGNLLSDLDRRVSDLEQKLAENKQAPAA